MEVAGAMPEMSAFDAGHNLVAHAQPLASLRSGLGDDGNPRLNGKSRAVGVVALDEHRVVVLWDGVGCLSVGILT